MNNWKNSVPDPVRKVYRKIRKQIFDPDSDWIFDKQYSDTLTVDRNNTSVRYNTSSLIAKRWFYPRYRDGSLHEPVVTRALLESLKPTSIFFDVGANVGFYTVLSSYFSKEVHSFEMDPRLISIINSHFDYNNNRVADVEIVTGAVSNQTKEYISFSPHISENPSTNSITTNKDDVDTQYTIPTLSLNHYTKQNNIQPDVLKIDVEGYEVAVLEGMSRLLPEVETVFLEIHPTLLDGYGYTTADVFNILDQYDFNIKRFTDHRGDAPPKESLQQVTNPDEIDSNTMLLFQNEK